MTQPHDLRTDDQRQLAKLIGKQRVAMLAMTGANGLLEEATSAFELAVELSPANPAVLSQVSWSYAQAGLLEKALHYIEQAIALDPSTGGYLANRAGIYRDLGQPVQALEDALKAVEIAPDYAIAHAMGADTAIPGTR